MAKIDPRRLSPRSLERLHTELWDTLERFRNRKDALTSFLSIFITASERVMLARRIDAAKLLLTGVPIRDICQALRIGITTVQRVDQVLRQLPKKSQTILAKHYRRCCKKRQQAAAEYMNPHSFKKLRRKYPAHFLLFNLLLDEK